MVVAIHVNITQPHQVEHGQWLRRGFERLGIKAEVTNSPTTPADIHVVSGPHFAKQNFLNHPRTILLDRAYYHEEKTGAWKSMDWVSLGWMRPDGGRDFKTGTGRLKPAVRDRSSTTGTIFLADYCGPVELADHVRHHPSQAASSEPLRDALRRYATAIGYQTTALVTAALEGLEIICRDNRNIMADPNWLELLPYADWHFSEIESGEALEHILDTQHC
jgi:hypothetical protein